MFSRILGSTFFLASLSVVFASIYVNDPTVTSTCYGGQPCTVTWLDDGQAPLLSKIGACYIGLYNGNGVLVQQIEPVNVASQHSLTFTPDPIAGPDSSSYYINFTSVLLMVNQTSHYTGYSVDFTLANMIGNLASPVASDTSIIAVPSSVLSPSTNSISTVATVTYSYTGSYSSLSTLPIPTSSVFSRSQSATATSSSSSPMPSTSSSAAQSSRRPGGLLSLALGAGLALSYLAFL